MLPCPPMNLAQAADAATVCAGLREADNMAATV
jgi:hypothetical protein